MKDDDISRQAAIDVLSLGKEMLSRVLDDMDVVGTDREKYSWGLGLIESDIKDIEELPSAQPERLTDDDFETIRIHLNAYKEKLCNQKRWKEAEEYQRIIDRFMAFASAQPEVIHCRECRHHHYESKDIPYCDRIDYGYGWKDNDFCSKGKRRTDE